MELPKPTSSRQATSALRTILWSDKMQALLLLSASLSSEITNIVKEIILPPKASKAVIAVLSIPELLSKVLSHLPAESILPLQRVCKKWQLIISSLEPEIKIALYMQPSPPHSNVFLTGQPIFNPILAKKSDVWLKDRNKLDVLNLLRPPGNRNSLRRKIETRPRSVHLLPWYREIPIWRVENASWRNMLVVQPPCKKLAVVKMIYNEVHFPLRPIPVKEVIDCGNGLRMGLLYDIVEAWLEEGKESWEDDLKAVTNRASRRDLALWDDEHDDSLFFHVFSDEKIWSWMRKIKAAAEEGQRGDFRSLILGAVVSFYGKLVK